MYTGKNVYLYRNWLMEFTKERNETIMETVIPSIVVLIIGAICYYLLYIVIERRNARTPDEELPITVYMAIARGLISCDDGIRQLKSLGITQREAHKAVCLALKEYDTYMRKEEESF